MPSRYHHSTAFGTNKQRTTMFGIVTLTGSYQRDKQLIRLSSEDKTNLVGHMLLPLTLSPSLTDDFLPISLRKN